MAVKKLPDIFKGIPKNLRISTSKYDVNIKPKLVDGDVEFYGLCYVNEKKIELSSEHTAYPMVEIFIHEILHAIFKEYLIRTKNEETIVETLAKGLTNVFIDNPKLLDYLKLQLNKGKF